MDYLFSLVGKDQETITQAIKELAENSEKVKCQEKEIKQLDVECEEIKEEVHYLRNKIELKRDIFIDLEHEGENKSEELNKIKKELVMKEKGQ